ncbi:hypothetical protein EBT25_08770 [bacterium]|nr:hypothetical protein [bacterium]
MPSTSSTSLPGVPGKWGSDSSCGSQSGNASQYWAYELFGYTNVGTSAAKAPKWIESLNQSPVVGPALARTADSILVGIAGLMTATVDQGTASSGAGTGLAIAARVVSGIVSRWIGFNADYFTQSFQYDIQYFNPQLIPSEADFVQLYLGNAIDDRTLECMVRANGSYPYWYKQLASVNRTKLSVDQVISLNRRGIIADDTAAELIRGSGVTNSFEKGLFYKATESLPTVSDIVRFMVRDADDPAVAQKYGTDAALSTKYGDQLKSWARAQGITDEVMQYYWRSHWDIPSNTALMEMFHRLRPRRASGAVDQDVVTTQKDVEDALVVNDMLPFWAKRMMAISFRPLTRTDAQRAFFIDAIDEKELFDVYMDLGYKSEDATRLVRFSTQLKKKRAQSAGSTEKPSTTLKYYKGYLLTRQEALSRLQAGGLSEAASNEALNVADVQRRNESQLQCLKGIRANFKRFIFDDIDARREMLSLGVPPENVDPLLSQWKCERTSKPKELTAAQVCKAYKAGLMNQEEYFRRLKAIGYYEDETGILLELCSQEPAKRGGGKKPTNGQKATMTPMEQTEAARAVTAAAAQLVSEE